MEKSLIISKLLKAILNLEIREEKEEKDEELSLFFNSKIQDINIEYFLGRIEYYA